MFIDNITWKCLLGPRSLNVNDENNIYSWGVQFKGKVTNHFCTDKILSENDLPILNKIGNANFHYLSIDNIEFLKKHYNVSQQKKESALIEIGSSEYKFVGRHYHGIRHALNSCAKQNYSLESNYRDIKDIKIFLDEWADTLADKYFRSNHGKNLYFLKNNWHANCINLFVYKDTKLVSMAILSKPVNGQSSYVMGKALCKSEKGLSEFTDVEIYKKALALGTTVVNLGQSEKGLKFYKSKFPASSSEIHYNGSIEKI